jgi:stromal membrane-associated protein
MSDMTKQAHIFEKILKKEENKLCADCRRKSPSWASLNLGVLICMKCSGKYSTIKKYSTENSNY